MLLDSQIYTILIVALVASTLAIRLGLTLYEQYI